jgi:multiple antibiotic resistance protein
VQIDATEAVLLLLATIGPFRVTIVCAALTADATDTILRQIALRSVLIAAAVCVVFAVVGEAILRVFHVSIPAFQIAGGIIVLLFSLESVLGRGGKDNRDNWADGDPMQRAMEIAVYPLAVPLMASVSGLVAIVSLVAQSKDFAGLLFLTGTIVVIMALDYLCLRSCHYLVRVLGQTTLQVVGKVMGVILAALAVELMLMGLAGLGLRLER